MHETQNSHFSGGRFSFGVDVDGVLGAVEVAAALAGECFTDAAPLAFPSTSSAERAGAAVADGAATLACAETAGAMGSDGRGASGDGGAVTGFAARIAEASVGSTAVSEPTERPLTKKNAPVPAVTKPATARRGTTKERRSERGAS